MWLTNKSEGEQHLKPSNSEEPNEDQEETQQPKEASSDVSIPT
jgi:hypothetical protein